MQQRDVARDFYLLRGAAHEDIAAVDAVAERSRLPAGATVFHEGDRAEAMYRVAHGTVEVLKSGDETAIATMGTGDEFGEVAFFDDGRRSATVRTREPTELIKLSYAQLRDVLARRPALALLLYRNGCTFLAKRLRQTTTDVSFARELNRRHL
jgi:CRP-like cAMP-binding protein